MPRAPFSPLLFASLVLAIATSAKAGTVIADFNDLNLGQLNEAAEQPADTGSGFTETFWPHDSSMVIALDGDLTPPAGSNYVSGQTGTGRSLGNSFGTRTRQNQTRNCELLAEGTVWLSALFSLNGTDAEGTITFNGNRLLGGGTANLAPAISFGDNGTPGAVGTLLPSEDALANVADTSQRVDAAVATDGAAHLLIAKLELRDGDDTITLWLDPADVTDEASLGTPLLAHTGAYFDTNVIERIGYEIVREDDPGTDPNGGLALLDNLKLSDASNALAVVASNASYNADGVQVLANGDFEASGGSLDAWQLFDGNVVTTAGFSPGSATAAQITAGGTYLQQDITVTADWFAEFYFQIQDTTARAFNVNILATNSAINIRYQGDSGQWNAYDSAGAGDGWGGIDGNGIPLGLGSITPGATYFMRVVGHDWGTATPTYDLYLSKAGSSNLTRSALGLTRYQNGVPTDSLPRAIRFTTQYGGNPGFSVDDVHVTSGPAPSDAQPFALTNLTYAPASDEFTITWNSDPSRVYGIFYSADAVDWKRDVNDSIGAALRDTQTTFGPFPNPLTTDSGTPDELRPPIILFRVTDQGQKL